MLFCRLLIFSSKSSFSKKSFRNTIRVFNGLEPGLDLNCLQRLSVDGNSRLHVGVDFKTFRIFVPISGSQCVTRIHACKYTCTYNRMYEIFLISDAILRLTRNTIAHVGYIIKQNNCREHFWHRRYFFHVQLTCSDINFKMPILVGILQSMAKPSNLI